jgi:hypothetical protein
MICPLLMSWPRILLVVLCLVASAMPAFAGTSGNEYGELPEELRLTYVAGILDAWDILGPMMSEAPAAERTAVRYFGWLIKCAADKGMTRGQVRAIVDKYLTDNPSEGHMPVAFLIWKAMIAACKS